MFLRHLSTHNPLLTVFVLSRTVILPATFVYVSVESSTMYLPGHRTYCFNLTVGLLDRSSLYRKVCSPCDRDCHDWGCLRSPGESAEMGSNTTFLQND